MEKLRSISLPYLTSQRVQHKPPKGSPSKKTLTISTKQKDQIIDIPDKVELCLRGAKTENGLCRVFVAHTTSAVTMADLDPGTGIWIFLMH
ncbi:MAG: hypothetical protein NVS9B9_08040 [Ktedonobacteraceae bacterium]